MRHVSTPSSLGQSLKGQYESRRVFEMAWEFGMRMHEFGFINVCYGVINRNLMPLRSVIGWISPRHVVATEV